MARQQNGEDWNNALCPTSLDLAFPQTAICILLSLRVVVIIRDMEELPPIDAHAMALDGTKMLFANRFDIHVILSIAGGLDNRRTVSNLPSATSLK